MRCAVLILCTACASALHAPPPLESIAAPPRSAAGELLAEADAAWVRRAEPGQAARAEELYLQAARAEPQRAESFGGAIRAKAFRLGRTKDGGERLQLAQEAVVVGQLCEQTAPAAPLCDYWLAAALGLQARERSATAKDALGTTLAVPITWTSSVPSVARVDSTGIVFFVAPGTKPRIPTTRKTTPNRTAIVLTIICSS